MLHGHSVLVVDEVSDTEEVLRAVLEPRGLRVDRVRRQTPLAARQNPPSVMVIDAEVAIDADETANWPHVPQVIIGTARMTPRDDSVERHYLRKPFEYAELVHTIERLIER